MTGFDIGSSLGVTYVGILFAQILYASTCAQVLYYSWYYHGDRLSLQLLVAVLWFLDTAATIVDVKIIWRYLISGHADLTGDNVLFSDTSIEYALSAIMVLIVQCFYMRTIWTLLSSKRYNVPLIGSMVTCAVISCVCGFVCVYVAIHDPGFPNVFARAEKAAVVQITTASIVDVFISATLMFKLSSAQSSSSSYMDKFIHRLKVHAINRGILTTLIQVMTLITFVTFSKDSVYWSIFHLPGSKVYVNSLLAILNARHHYVPHMTDVTSGLLLSTAQPTGDSPLDTVVTVDSEHDEFASSGSPS
ncbi:uncharacterized protein LAESUDRAFT_815980 [Laetiporus sulphureus 93-53]|uniref:DUF6534 domain-containing protein n=1 Tax=Laetiporus sulphureus 93-53 TaxID=1314785 RepID=A0A165BNG3_9APHY|nr:uncharacterized protein LAESUDRAFT_815980 [Laetiporus sulphureus 93-53]KZT01364.1 hypothetical protein LAESUDRAFT_815980 [Laetiporus sulphureus 93-53]